MDVLIDRDAQAADIASRATMVAKNLLTPVPTVTPNFYGESNPNGTSPTITIFPTSTQLPTKTKTKNPTSTLTLQPTWTATTPADNYPRSFPTYSAPSVPSATPKPTKASLNPTAETATPTPTGNAQPTNTPTETINPTSTVTQTIAYTSTSTLTPSPTETSTPTPIPTETPSSAPISTSTSTPTSTLTATNTLIPAATYTSTKTPTATPIPTATMTPTSTPMATATLTSTPTPTATFTPTSTSPATPTPTATYTPTPTHSLPNCFPGVPIGILPSDDAFIRGSSPDSNFGSHPEIEVRPDNGANRRGLIRFDLSSIPPGSTVTSATLYLYEEDKKLDQVTYLYKLTSAWDENSVTWNSPWTNSGGDFENSQAYASFLPNQTDCMLTIDLTELVREWVNGKPNYGFLLYSTGPNHILRYSSKDNSAADQHPKLDVTYIEPISGFSYADDLQVRSVSESRNNLVE